MSLVNTKSVVFAGGSSQYIALGNVLAFERTDTFSVCFWAKWTDATQMCFVGKCGNSPTYTGWSVLVTSSGYIQFYLTNNYGTPNYAGVQTTNWALKDGLWHFIVCTYDGSSNVSGMKVYVDDTLQSKSTLSNTLSASIVSTDELEFGARVTSGSRNFYTGHLDEVAIYNKELTAAEAHTLWLSGPDDLTVIGPTANLVGWWRMGDGDTYPTLLDYGSGGNDGTMTSMSAGSIVEVCPPQAFEIRRRAKNTELTRTGDVTTTGDAGESYASEYAQNGVEGLSSYRVSGDHRTYEGGGGGITVYYVLRARDTGSGPPPVYITWTSTDPASSPPTPPPVGPWGEQTILTSWTE